MHTSTINIYDVYKEEAATHLNEHVERFASEASDGLTARVRPIAPAELFGAVPLLPVQLVRHGEVMLHLGLIHAHQGRHGQPSSEQHRHAFQQNWRVLHGLLDLTLEGDSHWHLCLWHSHSTNGFMRARFNSRRYTVADVLMILAAWLAAWSVVQEHILARSGPAQHIFTQLSLCSLVQVRKPANHKVTNQPLSFTKTYLADLFYIL